MYESKVSINKNLFSNSIGYNVNTYTHNANNDFHFFQQGQSQFEDRWPSMRPTALKLLRQEPVTKAEWQDLFW